MTKFLIFLYLTVFSTYVLFTREPDFFDSETAPAIIHISKDSTSGLAPFAQYKVSKQLYQTDARYLFRSFAEGEKVEVIYSQTYPSKGAVYSWWGYWVTWQELLASIALLVVMFQAAKAITRNPTPEGLLSELEDAVPKRRRKYD